MTVFLKETETDLLLERKSHAGVQLIGSDKDKKIMVKSLLNKSKFVEPTNEMDPMHRRIEMVKRIILWI
ncbi:hypothetical protein [Pediococcus parvulus]|uniref:hypothetical protein n=1 Tax=Pediococcus parvulus TaxID=54062 RepID=UPI00345F040E